MVIQYAILIFVVFVIVKTIRQHRNKQVSTPSMYIWLGFWILLALAALSPKSTDIFASYVGVARGADLLVYISILILFYSIFRLLARVQKLQQEMTLLVRTLGHEKAVNEKNKEDASIEKHDTKHGL